MPIRLVQPGCRRRAPSGRHTLRRREGEWGHHSQAEVRPLAVVDVQPGGGDDPGLEDSLELLSVEDLVPRRPVEALDERILLRTSLLDEDGLNTALLQKGDDRRREELTAVVGADPGGRPVLLEEPLHKGDDI